MKEGMNELVPVCLFACSFACLFDGCVSNWYVSVRKRFPHTNRSHMNF